MAYRIAQGVQVSLDGSTWYKLSDHNRSEIKIDYEVIENSKRMANGKTRKYVVANKKTVSTSWNFFPTTDSYLVDYSSYTKAAAWMKAFYEANVFQPVYIKLIYASETVPSQNNIPSTLTYADSYATTGETLSVYMTNFSYTVSKRSAPAGTTGNDFVDIDIEFTEI